MIDFYNNQNKKYLDIHINTIPTECLTFNAQNNQLVQINNLNVIDLRCGEIYLNNRIAKLLGALKLTVQLKISQFRVIKIMYA